MAPTVISPSRFIPDLVHVRLSTRSLTLAPSDESAEKWNRNFLREDVRWVSHYRPTPHAGRAATINNAMRQAWWPTIEACAALVRKHCAICTQDQEVERNVGLGIRSCNRFTWLIVDDKILPTAISAVTSYVSVLSMVDPASGATMYRLRKSMGALEASVLIFCNWICRYGIPKKLSSAIMVRSKLRSLRSYAGFWVLKFAFFRYVPVQISGACREHKQEHQ